MIQIIRERLHVATSNPGLAGPPAIIRNDFIISLNFYVYIVTFGKQ